MFAECLAVVLLRIIGGGVIVVVAHGGFHSQATT